MKGEGAAGDGIAKHPRKGCYNLWVLLVAHGSYGSHGRQSNRKAFCFQGNGSITRLSEVREPGFIKVSRTAMSSCHKEQAL
jgi:hypothetical protein